MLFLGVIASFCVATYFVNANIAQWSYHAADECYGRSREEIQASTDAINAQIPKVLGRLMAQSPRLSLDEVKVHFAEQTPTYMNIVFYEGGSNAALAQISEWACLRAADGYSQQLPPALYVADRQGNVSRIDVAWGGYHDIQWRGDHWLVITNRSLNEFHWTTHDLWTIAHQHNQWNKTQDIQLGTWSDFEAFISDSADEVSVTGMKINYLPCPIAEPYSGENAILQTTVVTTFSWEDQRYVQSKQRISPNVWLRKPDATPYVAENWQTLCADVEE